MDRVAIHDYLTRNAPLLARIYAGAVAIVDDEAVPGRTYFVNHAIREVANRLPFALAGEKRQRVEYVGLVDPIVRLWRDEDLPSSMRPSALPESAVPAVSELGPIEISRRLGSKIGVLVDQHEASGKRKAMVKNALSIAVKGQVSDYASQSWLDVTDEAVKFVHVPDDDPGEAEFSQCVERFIEFERALLVLFQNAADSMAELDEVLADANQRTG